MLSFYASSIVLKRTLGHDVSLCMSGGSPRGHRKEKAEWTLSENLLVEIYIWMDLLQLL